MPYGALISGLYLDGCRVNEEKLCLEDSYRKELLYSIGCIK